MGDTEVPVTWLQIDSCVAVAATWGVNQRMEDLPLYLSSSLYLPSNQNK